MVSRPEAPSTPTFGVAVAVQVGERHVRAEPVAGAAGRGAGCEHPGASYAADQKPAEAAASRARGAWLAAAPELGARRGRSPAGARRRYLAACRAR